MPAFATRFPKAATGDFKNQMQLPADIVPSWSPKESKALRIDTDRVLDDAKKKRVASTLFGAPEDIRARGQAVLQAMAQDCMPEWQLQFHREVRKLMLMQQSGKQSWHGKDSLPPAAGQQQPGYVAPPPGLPEPQQPVLQQTSLLPVEVVGEIVERISV
eukprot:TRINITY_DN9048_c0_g1_i2.p1 TRINITY_DN9048_c0_g1~~TRINITY_DN9048_c0_g1_i2.p1  ORF type:complete len:177 (+),score=46.75 TRINITY_DN9048_c0_g1_i2:57-533(+)